MLTFVRTSELIAAKWAEIDLENKVWLIPAERMKMRRPHLVPLCEQALALFKELHRQTGHREYVFPAMNNPRNHMSNNTVLQALAAMGYKGRMTGHGFRALAMSTIKEKLGYRHGVIDMQLAHAKADKIQAAYDRAQFLDERKVMMQAWGDYLDVAKTSKPVVVNPPFNVSDWGGDRIKDDVRWKFGIPPVGNANFGWLQHIYHHLAENGTAGVVLANGSMSSTQNNEGEIRKAMVEAGAIDCMIALPGQLFYSTQIPVCLWFLAKPMAKKDRKDKVLFIDARKLGHMVDRTRREFADADITKIAQTYHAWRGEKKDGTYEDIAGFCKSASLDDIRKHNHILTPGRYVGTEEAEDDGVPITEKLASLTATLEAQFAEGAKLEQQIRENLKRLQI